MLQLVAKIQKVVLPPFHTLPGHLSKYHTSFAKLVTIYRHYILLVSISIDWPRHYYVLIHGDLASSL